MGFDWKDFITLSEELYNSKSDEASLRSAISRAYYGAFCSIRPYCHSKFGVSSKSNDIHRIIIEKLKSSSNNLEYSTGNLLSNLREDRNNADYDSHFSAGKGIVEKSIRNSKYVIQNLKTLTDSESKS
jgi:uncharacterized protein (UPF0332 family)